MNVDIYFWIESDSVFFERVFEADPSKKLGTIENRKKIIDGKVQLHTKYWKSSTLSTQQSSDLDLLVNNLLTQSHELIVLALESTNTRVFLQIASKTKTIDKLCGFHFSSETLQRLVKLNISIDIDQVRDLKV
jgi:hypothetical protein